MTEIPAAPFRLLPVRQSEQRRTSPDQVCAGCLSGTCCTSEGPIYLTAFDILRLSALFDLSPGDFMRRFTQDRFDEPDSAAYRDAWVQHPESSFVTWLRRRTMKPASPCIFLEYNTDAGGTVRRRCAVHEARPLACREYYHDTCRTRWTGELAVIEAQALEGVRDGLITRAQAEREWRSGTCEPAAPLSQHLRRHFWALARRALRWCEANEEGAAPENLAAWQDAPGEKLNRLLSKKHLRLEERFGETPHGEQLHAFTAGNAFAVSKQRARLLRIAGKKAETDLFAGDDYPFQTAHRFMTGMQAPRHFTLLSETALNRRRMAVSETLLFPDIPASEQPFTRRDVAGAALAGAQALVRLASLLCVMRNVLEGRPPGVLERALYQHLRGAPERFHPGIDQVLTWAEPFGETVRSGVGRKQRLYPASVAVEAAELAVKTGASSRARCGAVRRLLALQLANGSWNGDVSPSVMEAEGRGSQGAFYYHWVTGTAAAVRALATAAAQAGGAE